MSEGGYSPTHLKMLAVLADGLPHSREELRQCLWDDKGPLSNIRAHLCQLRKVLRPHGQDILCELYGGTIHYRHVRLLASPYKG